jgi:hypothetical protein
VIQAAQSAIFIAAQHERRTAVGTILVQHADTTLCIAENNKVGAEDGDPYKYKPTYCSLFPLDRNEHDEWFVRQWDYEDEDWDLFCLNPKATSKKAAVTLQPELKLLNRVAGSF